jgi:L-ribulose-5-phosphate 3-epimerase
MKWITTGGSICFKPYTIEQALKGLAEAGFCNVELGAVSDFHKHLDPDRLDAREIANAKAMLAHYGLTCVSISGHAQMHTELGAARLNRLLGACDALGVQVLNTFTGDANDDAERQVLIENARWLADRAEAAGVRLCIENDSNLMPTARAGLDLLAEIGHDWIQLNYDPANVSYFAGVAPEDDVSFALQCLGHVHLKDKRGGKGVADFPPLGDGEIDVEGFLRRLRAAQYAGPVSMEIEFTNWEWPSWEACVEATTRGRQHWDAVVAALELGSGAQRGARQTGGP